MVNVDRQDAPTIAWVEISGWVLAKYIRYGSASLFTWWEIYEKKKFLNLIFRPSRLTSLDIDRLCGNTWRSK